jgi:hypothetical protein
MGEGKGREGMDGVPVFGGRGVFYFVLNLVSDRSNLFLSFKALELRPLMINQILVYFEVWGSPPPRH